MFNRNNQIAKLYDEHCNSIYKICYAYLHNKYDAEECLHDTFLLAIQK